MVERCPLRSGGEVSRLAAGGICRVASQGLFVIICSYSPGVYLDRAFLYHLSIYLSISHLLRIYSYSHAYLLVAPLRSPAARDAMAADPAATRADLTDRLLVGFVNVPAGVVLPMIGAIVSIMFYYFNNHMFQ